MRVCKHREGQPTLLSHQGAQNRAIFLETLAAQPASCCLMQQFATQFWEWRPAVRHPGQADAHAPAVPCPAPRRESFHQMCGAGDGGGARGAKTFLADRACDLSRISVLRRHWLTDPVIQREKRQREKET